MRRRGFCLWRSLRALTYLLILFSLLFALALMADRLDRQMATAQQPDPVSPLVIYPAPVTNVVSSPPANVHVQVLVNLAPEITGHETITVVLDPPEQATATDVPPTATEEPTGTPVRPVATDVPPPATKEPTTTPVQPTATVVLPTATKVPPTATKAPTGTPVRPVATDVPPTATKEPAATPVKPTSTTGPTATLLITHYHTNVRCGPALSYEVLQSTTAGRRFIITGQKDGWWRVMLSAGHGWIHKSLGRAEGDVASVPVVP